MRTDGCSNTNCDSRRREHGLAVKQESDERSLLPSPPKAWEMVCPVCLGQLYQMADAVTCTNVRCQNYLKRL